MDGDMKRERERALSPSGAVATIPGSIFALPFCLIALRHADRVFARHQACCTRTSSLQKSLLNTVPMQYRLDLALCLVHGPFDGSGVLLVARYPPHLES